MLIGPQYKIARRLDAPLFEKTQTAKFTLRKERKGGKGPWRPKGDFGLQMLEKQKARLSYILSERQFGKYVKEAVAKKGTTIPALFARLETRLDSVVYRAGFGKTRLGSRQIVSHGHILVNGKRVNVPSYAVQEGDVVMIRPASLKKPLFTNLDERLKEAKTPSWLSYDAEKKAATVTGSPKYVPAEHPFDLSAVVEFYNR